MENWKFLCIVFISLLFVHSTDSADVLGCYSTADIDSTALYQTSAALVIKSPLSLTDCRISCYIWGKIYSGIRDGSYCFCDDVMPFVTPLIDSDCDTECLVGDGICGVSGYLLVYDSVSLLKDIQLKIDKLTSKLTPGSANVSVVTERDGQTVSNSLISETGDSLSVSDTFSVFLPNLGEYRLTVKSMDELNMTHESSLTVVVYDENITATLACPSTSDYVDGVECEINIWSYGLYNITHNGNQILSNVEGVKLHHYGPEFPPLYEFYSVTTDFSNNDVLLPLTQFDEEASLLYWYIAGETAGTIAIEILERTSCFDYCYSTNECSFCHSTDLSCTTDDLCIQTAGCCSPPNAVNDSIRFNSLIGQSYTSVYQQTINLETGFQVYDVSAAFNVTPGQILKLKQLTGVVSQIIDDNDGSDWDMTSNTTIDSRFMIQAITGKPNVAVITQNITQYGQNPVQVTFTDVLDGTTLTLDKSIFVMFTSTEPTTTTTTGPTTSTINITLEAETEQIINSTQHISVLVKSLTNYTCVLKLNSTNQQFSGEPGSEIYITEYHHTTGGVFNLTVTCINSDSTQMDYLLVNVIAPMTGFTIINPAIVSGSPQILRFEIGSGGLPNLTVTLNDQLLPNPVYNTVSGYFELTVPAQTAGQYNLTILDVNSLSSESLTETVSVLDPLTSMTVQGFGSNPVTNYTYEQATTIGISIFIDPGEDDASVTVDWGDGHVTCCESGAHNHVYTAGGDCQVKIHASNLVSNLTQEYDLLITNPLNFTNLVLKSGGGDLTHDGKFRQIFYLDQHPATDVYPNQAEYWIVKSSGEMISQGSLVLNQQFYYTYSSNEEAVSVRIRNARGEVIILQSNFSLVWPISDMQINVIPAAVTPNEEFVVACVMAQGDNVIITWDFKNGTTENSTRLADGSVNTVTHSYSNVGVYEIAVTARNPMGSVVMSYFIHVEKPVNDNLYQITSNAPVLYPEPLQLTIRYVGTSAELPTAPSITVSYGNGVVKTIPLLLDTANREIIFTQNFTEPGAYFGVMGIQNHASSLSQNFSAHSIELIRHVTFDLMWQPLIPRNSNPLPGLTDSSNNLIFPAGFDLIFTSEAESGAPLYAELILTNLNTHITTYLKSDGTTVVFENTQPGDYSAEFMLYNELSTPNDTSTITYTFSLISPVTDLSLINAQTVYPNRSETFTVLMKAVCESCCIEVSFGDETPSLFYTPLGVISEFCLSASTVLQLTPRLDISHVYLERGVKTMSVTVKQPFISDTTYLLNIPVSELDCSKPLLSIDDARASFLEAVANPRSEMISFRAYTELVCSSTIVNSKIWKIYLLDEYTGERTTNIDITPLVTSTTAQLTIPKRFLQYGFYESEFQVSMNDEKTEDSIFLNKISTFVQVTRSFLIGRLLQGGPSRVVRGSEQAIDLNPALYTIDPDLQRGQLADLVRFYWFCRRIGEEYPRDPGTQEVLKTPVSSERDTRTIFNDQGGCYGFGPGAIESNGGHMTINSSLLLIGFSYEFYVEMQSSDGRQAMASTVVDITDEPEQPIVTLRCAEGGVCRQVVGGQRVNPTNRLALWSECVGLKCVEPIRYYWSIKYLDQYDFWRNIPNAENYVMGKNSRGIGVTAQLFSDYGQYKEFKFGVIIQTEAKAVLEAVGEADMHVFVNQAPYGGECQISHRTSTDPTRPFNISCFNWRDDDVINIYELYVETNNRSILIYYHKDFSNISVVLPAGLPSDNYTLNVYVRILDDSRSFAIYNIGKVQVERGEMSNLIISAQTLVNSHELQLVMKRGEISEVSAEIVKVSAILNQITAAFILASNDSLSGKLVTSMSANVDVSTDDVEVCYQYLQQEVHELEDIRNQLSEIRETCIEGMNKLGTGNMESLQILSGTLKLITDGVGEVNQNSQGLSSRIVNRLTQQLTEQTDTMPQEEIISVAENLVFSSNNIFQAANVQLEYPIKKDFESAKEEWLYDSNLESDEPWVDTGGDTTDSLNTLQSLTTNTLQQKKSASIVDLGLNDLDLIGETILLNMVPGESEVNIQNQQLEYNIEKNTVTRLSKRLYELQGNNSIDVPSYCDMRPVECMRKGDNQLGVVSLRLLTVKQNPFNYDSLTPSHTNPNNKNSYSSTAGSSMLSISYLDENLKLLNVRRSTAPFKISLTIDHSSSNQTLPTKSIPDGRENILVSEIVSIQSLDVAVFVEFYNITDYDYLSVFVKFDRKPSLTDRNWDSNYILDVRDSNTTAASLFINQSVINNRTGDLYISFAPLTLNSNATSNQLENLEANASFRYSVRTNSAGCYYYNEQSKMMQSDGCTVGAESTRTQIECLCTHLTSFAAGWMVVPNTINFTELDFDPSKNVTIYVTLSLIYGLYIIMMVWSHRKDKKDVALIGCSPLDANEPLDKYLYEVVISTGSRKNAGTKSNVYVILSGELDETPVMPISATGVTLLTRGGRDSLLLSTRRPLGELQYLRVWHDNSGSGKYGSWFLNFLSVKDLQTKEKWHFVASRWLAVEEDDGSIDRLIPVAGRGDLSEFSHLFTETTKQDLTDGHLWFSVFTRPPASRFSRIERVSCCLMLLMLSMVTSGMFYDVSPDSGAQGGLMFGPFTLTPEQIWIGFMTNLIVFIPSLIVIQLFRKAQLRKKRKSHLVGAVENNAKRSPDYFFTLTDYDNFSIHSPDPSSTSTEKKTNKKKPFLLHWCFRVLSWILLWLATGAATAFTFLYAVSFGNDKTSKWLTSMVISFLSSILVTQPIKVLLTAIFFSLVIRSPNSDIDEDQEFDEEDLKLEVDEEWIHESNQQASHKALQPQRKMIYQPPKADILARQRERRLKEVAMYDLIRELLIYLIFVMVVVIIVNTANDSQSFTYKKNLDNTFVKKGDPFKMDYTKIRNASNFWYWTKNVLIPGLRVEEWYNGMPPVGLRGFLSDRVSRLMGYAVIRQLRMKENSCSVAMEFSRLITNCVDKYDIKKQDETSYGVSWQPGDSDELNYPEYIYRSPEDLNGSPYWGSIDWYSGGGYVFEMRSNKEELLAQAEKLESEGWIDRYTRAIFVEFTVYNPGTNLFSVCVMLIECPSSGSMVSKWRFDVVRLIQYYGRSLIFDITTHAAFVLFIIAYTVKEIRCARKIGVKNYFTSFWCMIDFMILFTSVTAIVLYIIKFVQVDFITEQFKVTRGNSYMKFQHVLLWSDMYSYTVSLLAFLTIIKFIKLLRFNRKIGMLSATITGSAKSLAQFTAMFSIVFFTFVQLFHIILVKDMLQFKTIVISLETCLAMMLGKFDFSAMTSSNPLSPLFFFLFMVVNVFILLNMFLSIINESFTAVKSDLEKQSNEHELVDFMVDKFKVWTGLGKVSDDYTLNSEEIFDEEKELGTDSIGQFPVRIDMLMSGLKRVYAEGEIWHSSLDRKYFSKDTNKLKQILVEQRALKRTQFSNKLASSVRY